MSETASSPRRYLPARFTHWLAELLLVFLGAYAAFWLSNYQQHREEIRRHDQLLAAIEDEVIAGIENAKANSQRQDKTVAEFRRAYEAGEMPALHPVNFTTDYSATDNATLLQSGGYQLLQVKTLLALRRVESTLRAGLATVSHFQKLSDELIVPNLDQDISFFYDPATKKLRKRFGSYPAASQTLKTFFDDYAEAETDLLKQIQAERSGIK